MANTNGKQWSDYVLKLPLEARERYASKLMYGGGTRTLPDPYNLSVGWVEDPSKWPDITYTDIYFYLIETPGQFTHEALKAYKSLTAYNYVTSGHVYPIQYNNIDDHSMFCYLKTKVIPSQRLREKPHQPWVCLDKQLGTVRCAHCTCMAGLGEVCSHIAALLFKVDVAVKAGLTEKACTSEACKWNSTYRKELVVTTIHEAPLAFGKKRNNPVETVTAHGNSSLPEPEVLKRLKEVCPHAVFFKQIPPVDEEATDSADEDEHTSTHTFPPLLTGLSCVKQWEDYKCEPGQVEKLEEIKL